VDDGVLAGDDDLPGRAGAELPHLIRSSLLSLLRLHESILWPHRELPHLIRSSILCCFFLPNRNIRCCLPVCTQKMILPPSRNKLRGRYSIYNLQINPHRINPLQIWLNSRFKLPAGPARSPPAASTVLLPARKITLSWLILPSAREIHRS
jgi:hypothetical protein